MEEQDNLNGGREIENTYGVWKSKIPTIFVKTEHFHAEAIEMYDMPHSKILEMVSVQGPKQMIKMLELFKLAISPSDVEVVESLSFNEMADVVGQWASKSRVRWLEVEMPSPRTRGAVEDAEEELSEPEEFYDESWDESKFDADLDRDSEEDFGSDFDSGSGERDAS